MKNLLLSLAALSLLGAPALADGYKLGQQDFPVEFNTLAGTSVGTGDYLPLWDASADDWKKIAADIGTVPFRCDISYAY